VINFLVVTIRNYIVLLHHYYFITSSLSTSESQNTSEKKFIKTYISYSCIQPCLIIDPTLMFLRSAIPQVMTLTSEKTM